MNNLPLSFYINYVTHKNVKLEVHIIYKISIFSIHKTLKSIISYTAKQHPDLICNQFLILSLLIYMTKTIIILNKSCKLLNRIVTECKKICKIISFGWKHHGKLALST